MSEMFGPYRLDALIGRGGMGEVFRAVDTQRNREVALKRLPAGLVTNPTFTARFEAPKMSSLRYTFPADTILRQNSRDLLSAVAGA